MKIKIEYDGNVVEYEKDLMCEYDSNELYETILPHIIEGRELDTPLDIQIESHDNEFDKLFCNRLYHILGADKEPNKVEIVCDNINQLIGGEN